MTDPINAKRLPGWVQRLDELLQGRARTPFAWGRNDCCLFAADGVAALTGVDHASRLRGTYSTEAEALAVLPLLGGLEALGALAGPEVPPLTATHGDIGLIEHDGRQCLAICTGELWVAPTTRGLGAMPLTSALKAWRVPHG